MEATGKKAEASLDYRRIEKVIAYLELNYPAQPDLAEMARQARLSQFHFQRLFTRWAGISPKRFVQCLTVEHAKRLLHESSAVLDTALDAGLSGPGRLHDLFVSIEAVTPGEYKKRGAGLEIDYGFHATPFGLCLLGLTQRGICWLSFVNSSDRNAALSDMCKYWAGATFHERPAKTSSVAKSAFSRLNPEASRNRGLSLFLAGTNFQIKVWQALLRVPAGHLVSYQMLGSAVGAPNACRAVGAAVGRNPIAYLIPCHRVVRQSGALGGYHWGETRKRAMLGWETGQTGN